MQRVSICSPIERDSISDILDFKGEVIGIIFQDLYFRCKHYLAAAGQLKDVKVVSICPDDSQKDDARLDVYLLNRRTFRMNRRDPFACRSAIGHISASSHTVVSAQDSAMLIYRLYYEIDDFLKRVNKNLPNNNKLVQEGRDIFENLVYNL